MMNKNFRPKQKDYIGYNNKDNSLFDKDGYIEALKKYCDYLEKENENLTNELIDLNEDYCRLSEYL